MPRLAHSADSPLPGNLPLNRLCLPLTRHRNNNPAFPCKFHLPKRRLQLHLFGNTQNKKQDGAGLGGAAMWSCRGREALLDSPFLKDHSRKGKCGKVPILVGGSKPSFASTAQLMERLPHTGSHGVHTTAHRCGDTPSQLHVRPARVRDTETKHKDTVHRVGPLTQVFRVLVQSPS